jgi:hypothetical protein
VGPCSVCVHRVGAASTADLFLDMQEQWAKRWN